MAKYGEALAAMGGLGLNVRIIRGVDKADSCPKRSERLGHALSQAVRNAWPADNEDIDMESAAQIGQPVKFVKQCKAAVITGFRSVQNQANLLLHLARPHAVQLLHPFPFVSRLSRSGGQDRTPIDICRKSCNKPDLEYGLPVVNYAPRKDK